MSVLKTGITTKVTALLVAACAVSAGVGIATIEWVHVHHGEVPWTAVTLGYLLALAVVAVATRQLLVAYGRRLSALTVALTAVAGGNIRAEVAAGRTDELGALEAAAGLTVARLRYALITVGRSSEALHTGWRAVLEVSNQMSDTAETTAARATAAVAAAEQVSNNVHIVAAATEELAATIREVAVHASEASLVARDASVQAVSASGTVGALNASARRVEQVVELIQNIAGQTHLLALNATIEAARAGDAGRGFTVVADEVKVLAQETAQATEKVSRSVHDIQVGSGDAGQAINEITVTIERVSENQSAIAAAVEEQTAATNEIGRGAAEAALGSSDIAHNITRLADGARVTAYSGAQCRSTAAEIADVTAELEKIIVDFDLTGLLTDVSTIEREVVTEAFVVGNVTIVPDTVEGTGLHQFDYQGSWCHSLANAEADGTNSYSSMPGDTATLRFLGSRIAFFGVTDANHGIAAVSVDGGEETFLDQYSGVRGVAVKLWQSPQLAYGEHVFTLRVAGTMNAASRYIWTTVDRVEIG